ncbi:MAG: DNA/RNA non-specific endonuclease, partial [Oscillospiraceae bacterium]|nr:DNA/RNA non-specific endonuclease [Oscillospiraceae bacterium]
MSARTEKRRQGGISKERLILALIVVAVVIGLTALGLHLNGSLTLDNLLVELGLKEPAAVTISIDDIPEYSGEPYVILQDNQPDFDLEDLTLEPFETYSELDSLGRCGVAYANICLEIMPTEPRGDIGQVKPSGWQTVKYDCVDGKYLYNRCHLIGYQLAGENANKQNLITGTRYMNVVGMLPFENMVDDYVEETENHVLYRVTPVFAGDHLVASGVQ